MSEEVVAYIKKHNLESTLQTALETALKKQPSNPYKALAEYMDKLATGYSGSGGAGAAAADDDDGMDDFLGGIDDGADEVADVLPAIGTKERDARARKCGVPNDADDAKLLAAEHGTKLPDGHVVTCTIDDLPSEDEDEAETAGDMGDFAASIGGADDY